MQCQQYDIQAKNCHTPPVSKFYTVAKLCLFSMYILFIKQAHKKKLKCFFIPNFHG